MNKGKLTRDRVLRQAATLFNQRGYSGASFAELSRVTGLQKGGIYNHFSSKDHLALEAFDYAVATISTQFQEAVEGRESARARLFAVIDVFQGHTKGNPIPGGCPIMNTAIEADDTHPELRKRARRSMDQLRRFVARIVGEGIEQGEFRTDVDADEAAIVMIATLEGALMMSHLYRNGVFFNLASNHVKEYIAMNLSR